MSSQGPLQGGVVYTEKGSLFSRILHGVAGVLKDVGGAVIDHAPEILQGAATGLAATSLNQSRNIMPDYSSNLDFGSTQSSSRRISTPKLSTYQPVEIPQYKPSTIARDALRQVESRRQTVEPPRYTAPLNPLSGLVSQAASSPISPPRQSVDSTPYTEISNGYQQSGEAFLQALNLNLGRGAPAPIQEDWAQIQRNLSYAQRPVTYQQQVQQANAQKLAELQLQNQQAQLRLAEEQARTLRQKTVAQFNKDNFPKAVYNNRCEGKQDLWSKVHQGNTLTDAEMKQLFHAIDLQKYSASIPAERLQTEAARLYAERRLAENMVAHAKQDEEGNLYLGGVPIRPEDALYFALEDVRHFQQTDRHLTPKQLTVIRDSMDADLNANTAYEFINSANRHYPAERSAEKIQHKLIFDGKKLIDQQYKDSKLVRSVAYPATSGVIGSTDPKQKNQGPIPEGKYYLNTKDISHNPLRAVTNHFLGDWGLYRVPLHPDPKTNTFGRKDFYIHGGNKPGSAGCIDLGHNDGALLGPLMNTTGIIEIEVRYPERKTK